MKKLMFFIITILILAATALSATAIVNDKGLVFDRIYPSVSGPLSFTVHTSATSGSDIENVKVRVYILELGIYASDGPFDVGASSRKSRLFLDLPEYTEPGCYVVRISATSDGHRRTKHRWICV